MRERFVIPIILSLGLILYMPVMKSGGFILDDGDLFKWLSQTSIFDVSLFGQGGTYYRPVLMISFLIDKTLSGIHPGFMHFVNILLHVANSMLVYLNVRVFYPEEENALRKLPFAAAILFLVHPINTESVNWISGRSDSLAAFFTLLATYLVLLSSKDLKIYRLWLAAMVMVLGSMSKEVAFMCFPAFALFLLLYKRQRFSSPLQITWWWRMNAILPFIFGGLTYFFLRTFSSQHQDKGISTVTNVESYQAPISVAQQFITDFGFYIKKLFFPYPLSLAIDRVNPHYFWLGLVMTIFLIVLVWKRNYLVGMTLLIVMTIFPALLNSFLHIAWTPYAERYLYIPAAFFCIALALPQPLNKATYQRFQKIALMTLICILLPITVSRNWLWAEPLEMIHLTHQQNPDNPTVWSMYAILLANKQFYDEARDEFKNALRQHPDHLFTYASLADMEMYIKDPEAARDVLDVFFNKKLEPDRENLQIMLDCNLARLQMGGTPHGLREIRGELIETHLMMYKSDEKIEHLLKAAEFAIMNGDDETAQRHLTTLVQRTKAFDETAKRASTLLIDLKENGTLHE